jgi:hypothetical protein
MKFHMFKSSDSLLFSSNCYVTTYTARSPFFFALCKVCGSENLKIIYESHRDIMRRNSYDLCNGTINKTHVQWMLYHVRRLYNGARREMSRMEVS